jgi:hypothetical protein
MSDDRDEWDDVPNDQQFRRLRSVDDPEPPPADLDAWWEERRARRARRAKAEQTQARVVLATGAVFVLALVAGHNAFAFEALLVGMIWYLVVGRGKR